ncbi:twisted gastrulation protein homolog 1-A-like [Atheta coriaria]|uniref:twisted gastrulation protein homolog 1-A-like n=1 Tax=Dalotia coriaria TaxID=877792 RepID=UPI0031F45DE6
MWRYILPLAALAIFGIHITSACNEAVCAAIVSKCLLTQSCKCDFQKDCSCCKECSLCLSVLYDECCSCVGMCPAPNDTMSPLGKQSQVEDLEDKHESLFKSLTETEDHDERWTTYTFPVDLPLAYAPKNDMKYQMQSAEQEVINNKINITSTHNCTVAFASKCLGYAKCKRTCVSMGASSMRWFHDACCECVGKYCINYGINENRCRKCNKNEVMDNSIETADEEFEMEYDSEEDDM